MNLLIERLNRVWILLCCLLNRIKRGKKTAFWLAAESSAQSWANLHESSTSSFIHPYNFADALRHSPSSLLFKFVSAASVVTHPYGPSRAFSKCYSASSALSSLLPISSSNRPNYSTMWSYRLFISYDLGFMSNPYLFIYSSKFHAHYST